MHLTNFHFYNNKNNLYSKPVKGLQGYGLGYGFAFNGQEKDDEVAGEGNIMTAEFWEYDTRLGRRWNTDPEFKEMPEYTPYLALNNSPIIQIDPKGDFAFLIPVAYVVGQALIAAAPYVVAGVAAIGAGYIGVELYKGYKDISKPVTLPVNPPRTVTPSNPNKLPNPKSDPKNGPNRLPLSPPTKEDVKEKVFYVTYVRTKVNPDGTTTTYSGRTSGTYKGLKPTLADAQRAVEERNSKPDHKAKTNEGYGRASVDVYSTNKVAIIGREQQLIDANGRAQKDGGNSGNVRREVAKDNPNGRAIHNAANAEFKEEKHEYTGNN